MVKQDRISSICAEIRECEEIKSRCKTPYDDERIEANERIISLRYKLLDLLRESE
jgi:hypothetical protein